MSRCIIGLLNLNIKRIENYQNRPTKNRNLLPRSDVDLARVSREVISDLIKIFQFHIRSHASIFSRACSKRLKILEYLVRSLRLETKIISLNIIFLCCIDLNIHNKKYNLKYTQNGHANSS